MTDQNLANKIESDNYLRVHVLDAYGQVLQQLVFEWLRKRSFRYTHVRIHGFHGNGCAAP